MVYNDDPQRLKHTNTEPIKILCDQCAGEYTSLYSAAQRYLKRQGKHLCEKCRPKTGPKEGFWTEEKRQARSIQEQQRWTVEKRLQHAELAKASLCDKPQCTKEFWTEEKRSRHSAVLRASEKLQQAHAAIDRSGSHNGMFGKTMSPESRAKMSKSRTGKFGPNATAWKGGKTSFLRRLKKNIHERFRWYYRVFKRDGWICQQCGSKSKIDAHHIDPIVCVVKRLCAGRVFSDDVEKMEWLLTQAEIVDPTLENGITLCRKCHRDVHENWGSHTEPSKK
jgi:hypothetical protein